MQQDWKESTTADLGIISTKSTPSKLTMHQPIKDSVVSAVEAGLVLIDQGSKKMQNKEQHPESSHEQDTDLEYESDSESESESSQDQDQDPHQEQDAHQEQDQRSRSAESDDEK